MSGCLRPFLGDAPVKLALVGGTAEEGIDKEVLELGGADASTLAQLKCRD
jgi:hypothetical protein